MPSFENIWDTTAHILEPLLWFVGAYLLVRALIKLARYARLISGLALVGQLLPLGIGALLALWQADLLVRWSFVANLLKTMVTVFAVVLLTHVGDRWVVRRLEAEGRSNAIPRLMRDIGRGVLIVITFFVSISQYFTVDRAAELYTFEVDAEEENLFNQFLFSYKINPQTVLFAGYSDSSFGTDSIDLTRADRTVFLKIGYAFRL